MINISEVLETNRMILEENLDVRTITMGISLLDCADASVKKTCDKIYAKITRLAKDLVKTGDDIGREFGIPVVNKRVSITPAAIVGSACCKKPSDFVKIAKTLDRAAKKLGINFIGGYSAIVSKGMTPADELLIRSIPEAMAATERVCSSVNVGSTKTGIDMDAVRLMGEIVKETAAKTKSSIGCAKLVVLCNAPDDNPFMAGAFHGVSEADAVINVGVSGPGVVNHVLRHTCRGVGFETLCETIKKTAFKITRVGQLVAQEASKRLGVPFGIIDLSLAPTPAIGDSVADILSEIGLEEPELLRRRTLRCFHSRLRRPGDDRRSERRRPDHREARGDDVRLLRRPRHDRRPGLDFRLDDLGDNRRRSGDWNGKPEDDRSEDHSRRGEEGRRLGGVRRASRPRAGDESLEVLVREDDRAQGPHPRADSFVQELNLPGRMRFCHKERKVRKARKGNR